MNGIERLQNMRGNGIRVSDDANGRRLEVATAGGVGGRGEPRYDVCSLGGYSYPDPDGLQAGPTMIVEDYFGEDFPLMATGLTQAQLESMQWSWGTSTTATGTNAFSLAAIPHGSPRNWQRYEVDDARWWHEFDVVPQGQVAARSYDIRHDGRPVELRLQLGYIQE